MQVNITVDFGQDYRVSITPQDARQLWNQLGLLFGDSTTQDYWEKVNSFLKPLGNSGYEADTNLVSPVAMALKGVVDNSPAGEIDREVHKFLDEAMDKMAEPLCGPSPLDKESPETLRESFNAPFFGTPCPCKGEHGADCYREVHS